MTAAPLPLGSRDSLDRIHGAAALRSHAAVARALLDQLDRIGRAALEASSLTSDDRALAEQLADELGRLAGRIAECARSVGGDDDRASSAPRL